LKKRKKEELGCKLSYTVLVRYSLTAGDIENCSIIRLDHVQRILTEQIRTASCPSYKSIRDKENPLQRNFAIRTQRCSLSLSVGPSTAAAARPHRQPHRRQSSLHRLRLQQQSSARTKPARTSRIPRRTTTVSV
jgi:hypothetical protein